MTLSIRIKYYNDECHYTEHRVLIIVLLKVTMLSVVMLSVVVLISIC
jgi:hypothetical protein